MTKPLTTIESDHFETVPGEQLGRATGGYYGPGGAQYGNRGYGNGGYGNGGYGNGGNNGYGNNGYGRQPQYYTVQRGDNLSEIARDSGHSLNYLLARNPQFQANPNLIYPGQHVLTGWNYPSYSA